MSLVSVVIPCYDGERFVGEAIASVLAQTHGALELIVVDDGSTDGSVERVRAIADPRVRLVTQANAGVAAARNRGAAAACGEYLAFLDQDDLWRPDKLARQLETARARPEAGVVYTDAELLDDRGRPRGRWSTRYTLPRGDVFETLIAKNTVVISTVLMRRAIFAATEGFGPYRFVEDLALLLAIADRYPFELVNEPLVSYRLDAASTSRRLGLEVAVAEMTALCEAWMARSPARRAAVRRALARYLYIAGKTALYRRDDMLARRYFRASLALDARPGVAAWVLAARCAPRLPGVASAVYHALRGSGGAAPGTFGDPPPAPRAS
ncbi:MAG TPA: glycosyltransferase [Terriglobales bacterium]|nr:glycosyltransferase [Terriglobales bacterium]